MLGKGTKRTMGNRSINWYVAISVSRSVLTLDRQKAVAERPGVSTSNPVSLFVSRVVLLRDSLLHARINTWYPHACTADKPDEGRLVPLMNPN